MRSLLLLDGYDGGTKAGASKSEIWQWKDQLWNKIDSNDQPMRSLSAAAYIKDKDEIFVYGGIGIRGYEDTLRDAFVYSGKQWRKVADLSIGTHDHHEMVYDEANKTIVVYGGQTGERKFDTKTWLFKNDRWTALDIPSPGFRVHHAMAYDADRKKIVLYGGYGDNQEFDDTWEFDGNKWARMQATLTPGARGHHSMTYDPVSKRILLYGGDIGVKAKGDVWAWDGKKWEQLSDNGPQRILAAIAFDPDKNKLYVFGGNGGENFLFIYSDLWEWDGKKWEQVSKGDTYKFDMQKNMYIKIEK